MTEKRSIDGTTIVRRNARVVSRSLEGQSGALLLHLDTTAYHGINQVGGLVWDLVSDGISFDDLIGELQAQLESVPGSLVEDIAAFLIELNDRDLILLERTAPSTT